MPPGGLHPGAEHLGCHAVYREYQIRRSREEELTIELGLAGCFPAFPGDTVRLELEAMGLSGEYRVAEAENTASPETGEVCTLILRERI